MTHDQISDSRSKPLSSREATEAANKKRVEDIECNQKGIWPLSVPGWEAHRVEDRPHLMTVHRTDGSPVPDELGGQWTTRKAINAKIKELGLV